MKRLWICLLAFALLTGCGDSGDIAVTTVYDRFSRAIVQVGSFRRILASAPVLRLLVSEYCDWAASFCRNRALYLARVASKFALASS